MPSLYQMAKAVEDLVALKRDHLQGFERASYDRGFEPGPDLAFAGVRVMIMEGEAAYRLLRRLAPQQDALERWLAERSAAAVEHEPVPASPGGI